MSPQRAYTCDEIRDLAPLFVAGALTPDEEADVRSHLLTCSDPHEEVAAFGGAVQALLEQVQPAEPPTRLRDRLLTAAAADLAEGRHPASALAAAAGTAAATGASGPAAEPSPSTAPSEGAPRLVARPAVPAPVQIASRRQANVLRWALALAAVVIVALGVLGVRQQQDLQAAQAYRDGVAAALALAAQPGSQTAVLTADNGSASGLGVVGSDGTVRITMRGLTATAGTQVYTAWAIAGSGAPVPIGEFAVGGDGTAVATARAPEPAPGVVLALTLEPHSGATTPTLPIIAKGVARPTSG